MYKKKETIPLDFLIDKIEVDFYFFYKFLDVYLVQFRVLRLSKGLFSENYSIKKFTLHPYIEYQSFQLTAQLHLTREKLLSKVLFFFISLKVFKV